MDFYYNYIRNRIKSRKAFPSQIEKAIVSAIDHYNASGTFNLLYFINDECYCCVCSLKPDNNRYSISAFSCLTHTFPQIYGNNGIARGTAAKYDFAYFDSNGTIMFDDYYGATYPELKEYNRQLWEATGVIDANLRATTYVCGEYTDLKAFLYALQNRFGKIVPVTIDDNLNLASRSNFSKEVALSQLNTSIPARIVDHLGSKSLAVFIPNDSFTLESIFWKDVRWKDLIPEGCAICRIADTDCFYVNVSFEIDGFSNVFCKSDDKKGQSIYKIIYAPWGQRQSETSENRFIPNIHTPAPEDTISKMVIPAPEVSNIAVHKENEIASDSVENNIRRNPPHLNTESEIPETPIDSTEKENIQDRGELYKSKVIVIPEDSSYTFIDIFEEQYILESEEISIIDSHIYMPYQFVNVQDFIGAINKILSDSNSTKRLRRLKIKTQRAEDILRRQILRNQREGKEVDISESDISRAQNKQDEAFKRLDKNLKNIGIELTYEYSEFHDRRIEFSNGWNVEAGRGLDIYKKRMNNMEPIRCKDCTFTFTFGQKSVPTKRKPRKIQKK